MTLSFSPGAAVAVTCSESGLPESGVEDAIRRPAPSGTWGFDVKLLTTSAAALVRISMCHALSSLVLQGRTGADYCPGCYPTVSVSAGMVSVGVSPASAGRDR